jgi:hypothetical protein
MCARKPQGQTLDSQGENNLDADIAQLSSLLSQEPVGRDPDVAELLRTIEAADGMAQGVESKLDTMLENLDNLLASLEVKAGAKDVTESNATQRGEESK